MEWLPGVTLEEYARSAWGLSEVLAREATAQVARAVSCLHEGLGAGAPMIHRDLKPSNVMVVGGQNGLPRSFVLIDLGIARTWREGAEADTTRLGHPQLRPAGAVRLWADQRQERRLCAGGRAVVLPDGGGPSARHGLPAAGRAA